MLVHHVQIYCVNKKMAKIKITRKTTKVKKKGNETI